MSEDRITAIEDDLIARLKALQLSAGVLPYPDKDFETYEPMHGNGEILVSFSDETFGPTRSTDLVVQERDLFFEFTFVFSSLRSAGKYGGLYAHLEAVRIGLTGWRPDGCKKMMAVSSERVKRYKKRWWQYTQTWKVSTLAVELAEEEQGPILSQLTMAGSDGNETALEVP